MHASSQQSHTSLTHTRQSTHHVHTSTILHTVIYILWVNLCLHTYGEVHLHHHPHIPHSTHTTMQYTYSTVHDTYLWFIIIITIIHSILLRGRKGRRGQNFVLTRHCHNWTFVHNRLQERSTSFGLMGGVQIGQSQ